MRKIFTLIAIAACYAGGVNAQNASNIYLDIANHATIGTAGKNKVETLYQYDETKKVLVLSAYGAYQSKSKQKWVISEANGSSNKEWNDTLSVFKGTSFYAGTAGDRKTASTYLTGSNGTEPSREYSFFVTNVSEISALVDAQANNREIYLKVFEASPNATNDAMVRGNKVDSVGVTGKKINAIKITGLDKTKTYEAYVCSTGINANSHFMEIAFAQEPNTFTTIATGISTIATAPTSINENAPIYNLAGQQVSKSYKGVVIQNGRKFVSK